MALLVMLAEVGAAAIPAQMALLVMLADIGAAAIPAPMALPVMLAEVGAAAIPAPMAPLVVLALLPNPPLDWMRRRGVRRRRCCWGCLFHGGEL